MLTELSLQDLLLVRTARLHFTTGLTVLTGETGAGKSILLAGLELALGGRADKSLIRAGAAQAVATAVFTTSPDAPLVTGLTAQAILPEPTDTLVLRRVLRPGGSLAYINDQPVSARTLHDVGQALVEIHGQNAERTLLDPQSHLALVDRFAGHPARLEELAQSVARLQQLRADLQRRRAQLEQDARDRDWLEHAVHELEELAPESGEEARLAELRTRMQRGERLDETIVGIALHVSSADGALAHLRQAARYLERLTAEDSVFQDALDAIDRALVEGDSIEALLETARARFSFRADELEATELRLFALRAAARKYQTDPDALAQLAEDMKERLGALRLSQESLAALATAEKEQMAETLRLAEELSRARQKAAEKLDAAVQSELPALKLGSTRFRTRASPVPLGERGIDQLRFEIATNDSNVFGPMTKIASGGELSRLILALKVVLAGSGGEEKTIIFDEIDRGVGGATAAAIGARLARLAQGGQVVVVTHSPQVAAAGNRHFRIAKEGANTTVDVLDEPGRITEIARMLSGARITAEARAQAQKLRAAYPPDEGASLPEQPPDN